MASVPEAQPVAFVPEAQPAAAAPAAAPALPPRSATPLVAPWFRWALLALAVVMAAYVVIRPGADSTPAAWQKTALEVVTSAAAAPETVHVTGGYLPDRGLVFTANLNGVAPKELNSWLLTLLKSHEDRLGELARGESVVWQVTVTGTTSGDYSRLVAIPRRAVADPAQWISTPATGAAGTATGADDKGAAAPAAGEDAAGDTAATGKEASPAGAEASPAADASPKATS
ncbi:hypothetical protein AB0J80_13475 [Actinoplanes sp. NPDC049548]|uniref:hypothetical protein n=1 Tax=Actinoplanes sp. NPDC049548 TaxID=3155152 RepID=UPI003441458B